MKKLIDFIKSWNVWEWLGYPVFLVLCLIGVPKAGIIAHALGFVLLTAFYIFGVFVVRKLRGK